MFFESFTGAFTKHTSWVNSVDINNQNIIASASGDEIFLWDNMNCITRLNAKYDIIRSVAFSPDSKLIVSGSANNNIKIWSVADKKLIKELPGFRLNKVAFDQSGKYIISAGYKDNVKIWDWKQGKLVKELSQGALVMRTGFSISKNNILAFIDSGCNVELFDINTLKDIDIIPGYCGVAQISPDGERVAVKAKGKIIRIIDIKSKKVITEIDNSQDFYAFEPFKFSPDGKWLVNGVGSNLVEVWDWRQNKLVITLGKPVLSGFEDFAFNTNGDLLTAGGDRSVKVYDLLTGDLKVNIGNGEYQTQLTLLLLITTIFALFFGFCGILYSTENKYSSFSIISILTVWSFGVYLLLYLIKPPVTKYATGICWIATIISTLFFASLYGARLALYTIPIALIFGHQQIMYDRKKEGTYIPVFINLIFCLFLCYLVYFKD